jgi:hypothetical protein
MSMKQLPIGVSSFERIITSQTLYVDKTKILYHLIGSATPTRYFLSRPRRFGKSLTCSTLEAIFSGRQELFQDLWLGQSDYAWKVRPVVQFDFSVISHESLPDLIEGLHAALDLQAQKFNLVLKQRKLKEKLAALITTLGQSYAPVAVIIDEYDKPVVDLLDNITQVDLMREELKHFYGALKGGAVDAHMHCLFITGVSKFSKVALFSDLNNLADLTNDECAAALVGYTDTELDHYFKEHIQALADKSEETYDELRTTLKAWYNGYRFSKNKCTVYNPFSLHNCLTKKDFSNYWFTSGTPTFLMTFIQKNPDIIDEIATLEGTFFPRSELDAFDIAHYYQSYRTLLLQTGYLTFISDYDADSCGYQVGYPNQEVRYSMTEQIMHCVEGITTTQFGQFGGRFRKALVADDLALFCHHLEDFIKLIPHNIRVKREKFFHQIVFMICVLFGRRPATEVATGEGFMDLLMEGSQYTFVVEFKKDSTPKTALKQIEAKRYWEPYEILSTKKIVLAGIAFNHTKNHRVSVLCETKALPS